MADNSKQPNRDEKEYQERKAWSEGIARDPNASTGKKLFVQAGQSVDDMFHSLHNVEDKIASATGIKAVAHYIGDKAEAAVSPLMDKAVSAVRSSLKLDSNQMPPPSNSTPSQSQQHTQGGR